MLYCMMQQYQLIIIEMQQETGQSPMKNVFTLTIKKENPIEVIIRSNFDSGNANKAQLGINNIIIITPAHDCAGTVFQSQAKGWFHFAVKGIPAHSKQKFVIRKMNQLGGQVSFNQSSRNFQNISNRFIVTVVNNGGGQRALQHLYVSGLIIKSKDDDTQLHFQFKFEKSAQVFFAYSFPFAFQECQKLLKSLNSEFRKCKNIYYKDEVLIRSPQGRPLHLLTISSHESKQSQKQQLIDKNLFEGNESNRANSFGSEKKVIIISARVHPGQTPSSHTMNGLLKFLLSKDARAYALRKAFVFKIVPMLNPDGVYNGHYRMDIFNQNLNRHYLDPDPFKHPSAYAMLCLGLYYKGRGQLAFYIDLHAHPQRKGNFIYGNSLQNQQQQVQTQLFPKLLALNCVQFDYQNSSFAKKQMTSKDRNDELTKQGCGRVVFNKVMGQTYAYTLECGYTQSTYLNELSLVSNQHRKIDKHGLISDQLQNVKSSYYAKQNVYFSIRSYQNLGRAILISILDLYEMNPFSRIPNTMFKDLDSLRKDIAKQVAKQTKDFRIYAKNLVPLPSNNVSAKIGKFPVQLKKKNNSSFAGKSIPKRASVIKQQVFKSENFIKIRNRTLPRMKQKQGV